ncbi:MAG: peptidoglycan bridge formation glycyltransferase FemA/FemB family protein, partial [Solobacterium sp.]|nr:peptidoglycan bridge formation glycyltransferase FemA/FemB family protein [Solobacterium sp.]
MTYKFHTDTDPVIFDRFVMASEQNTLFQCSDWLKIKTNWQGMLTSVTEDCEIVAAGLVLIRSMPL